MSRASEALELLRQASKLRYSGNPDAAILENKASDLLAAEVDAEQARAAAPAPRDACLMFRAGKLIAVETAKGVFPLSALYAVLSVTDRMIVGQLAARVDKLIDQLGAAS